MMQVKMLMLLLISIVLTPLVRAQTKDTTVGIHQVSALQAVDMALKQRSEILNSQLDIKNQEAMNAELTGTALPQVIGSASGNHYFNIPVTVLPDFISPSVYGVLEKEGVKDGSGNPVQVPNNFATVPAQFGTPWQAAVGFSVQQLLFQQKVGWAP